MNLLFFLKGVWQKFNQSYTTLISYLKENVDTESESRMAVATDWEEEEIRTC